MCFIIANSQLYCICTKRNWSWTFKNSREKRPYFHDKWTARKRQKTKSNLKKCIDLLNPQTQVDHFYGVGIYLIENIIEYIMHNFPRLRCLQLNCCIMYTKSEMCGIFAQSLPSLKYLEIKHCQWIVKNDDMNGQFEIGMPGISFDHIITLKMYFFKSMKISIILQVLIDSFGLWPKKSLKNVMEDNA